MNYVIFYTLCILRSCHDTNVVLHGDTFEYCASIGRAVTKELLYVDHDVVLTWKCLPAQGPVQERNVVLMTPSFILRNGDTTVPIPDYIDGPIIAGPETDGPFTGTKGATPSTTASIVWGHPMVNLTSPAMVDLTPEALEKIRDACRSTKDKGAR